MARCVRLDGELQHWDARADLTAMPGKPEIPEECWTIDIGLPFVQHVPEDVEQRAHQGRADSNVTFVFVPGISLAARY